MDTFPLQRNLHSGKGLDMFFGELKAKLIVKFPVLPNSQGIALKH